MEDLSEEQQLVLDKIKLFIKANGYSPTVRDLCFLTDKKSTATINYHLQKLKEKKYINYVKGKGRTIRVLEVK